MNPISTHRGKMIFILLVLLALACQMPQPVATAPPLVPVTPVTGVSTQGPALTQPAQFPAPTLHLSTPLPQAMKHRISTHSVYGITGFYDRETKQSFTPRGVNYAVLIPILDHYEDHLLAVGFYDHNRVKADFAALRLEGYNTVRILLDGCSTGVGCLTTQEGKGLDGAYLDNLVDLMNLAREANLFLLLGVDRLPAGGGYGSLASQGASSTFAAGRNAELLTPQGVAAARQFWDDLLNGLTTRHAPTDIVLGWELLAEQYFDADQPPFSLQEGKLKLTSGTAYDLADPVQVRAMAAEGIRTYTRDIRSGITSYDPTALVGMGFLVPDAPNVWREGDSRFVEVASLLSNADLDFFDLHASPGMGLSLQQVSQNFGIESIQGRLSKPIIMGDVGASTWAYPEVNAGAIAIQDWIASSCAVGISGWIYNGYYPDPAGLNDATWGFVDSQGRILKALSPKTQPDPCQATVLPGRDLARGKDVAVTASLPDQVPQMAVDGDPNTQWSSGGFPMQWIQVDLGQAYTIGEIRLTVGMWPSGKAVHQVWVGAKRDALQMVQEFSGEYYDYDVLSFVPQASLGKIRYVRIVTTDSPSWVSWREVEVLAP